MKQALNKVDGNYLILAFITTFFVISNIIWTWANQAPPMWDQAHYLHGSDILYHKLTTEGMISFVNAYTNALWGTKAPLITVLPIPFYILGGDNYTSALSINLFFIVVGSFYLYKLASLISGPSEGLLSVFILNTFPLIFAMSREFLVEYGLMVLVIIWMYYLLKSDCFEDRTCSYVLGIMLGLGMLMKITFVLYILFPTLFIITKRIITSKKMSSQSFKNIIMVVLTGVLISGTWYFKNLRHIVGFALTSGYSNIAKNYGLGDVFSIKTILLYWGATAAIGISAYYFLFMIFLFLQGLVFFIKHKYLADIKSNYVLFLSVWLVLPFLVFTFGVNKDYRYAAPLYPALALLMSISLVRMSSRSHGTLLVSALLLFPAMNYLFISFSPKAFTLNIGQVPVLSNHLAFAHPPVKELWPYDKLINTINDDASRTNNTYALTTLLFDHEYMNRITSNYYAENKNLKLRFETCDYTSKETIEETVARIDHKSDYLVTKSDKLGPDFSNVKNQAVVALLNKGKLNFRRLITIQLPDQTLLTVYKINIDTKEFINKASSCTNKMAYLKA